MRKLILAAAVGVLCVAAFWVAGCDDGAGYGLTVTPADVDLAVGETSQGFAVGTSTNDASGLRALSLPLEWSVSNPSLGYIVAGSGASAVYVRTATIGINVITVQDQYGAEGIATVRQH
jgi:hypothetical protein